ncbi:hypothetical protein D3C81_2322560 [compost metagenome]
MSKPTVWIIDAGSKETPRSVVIDCARITTSVRKPCFLANASLQMIAAAAPQVGGHAIKRVITPGQST